MYGDAGQAVTPCPQLHLHLGINVAGGFSGAAPAHGIESYGLLRLVVDGVGGLEGRGRAGSRSRACVDFGGQLRLGGDRRLGPGRLGRLGEKRDGRPVGHRDEPQGAPHAPPPRGPLPAYLLWLAGPFFLCGGCGLLLFEDRAVLGV